MSKSQIVINNGTTSFVGREAVDIYVAIMLKSGLRLYAKTGIKPSRSWTPTAMLAKASELAGRKFKRGQYAEAAEAMEALIKEVREGRGEVEVVREDA